MYTCPSSTFNCVTVFLVKISFTVYKMSRHFPLSRKLIRKCSSAMGIFQMLTILVIILYLIHIRTLVNSPSNLGRNSNSTGAVKPLKTFAPLFSIPKRTPSPTTSTTKPVKKCSVTIAIILCQDDRYLTVRNKTHQVPQPPNGNKLIAKDFSRQINQTLVLLKSIAILTKQESPPGSCVEVLILSDKPNHYKKISSEIKFKWSLEFQQLIKLTNIPVRYPPGANWMRKLFRPCATLRLFLAELLPERRDSIIYVDTDVIFFQSVQALWTQFERFEEKKLAAMAPCLFHYGSSANEVPYFGTSGLNAGIMLMNLTRMRGLQWTNKIRMVTTMFQDKIKLADQDILNIYFHFFPEELHVLTCDWNFRPFQCRDDSACEDPEIAQGISALHGNALSFTSQGPEPLFRTVFQTFHKAKLDGEFKLSSFVEELEKALWTTEENIRLSSSQCKRFGGLDILVLNRLYGLVEDGNKE